MKLFKKVTMNQMLQFCTQNSYVTYEYIQKS